MDVLPDGVTKKNCAVFKDIWFYTCQFPLPVKRGENIETAEQNMTGIRRKFAMTRNTTYTLYGEMANDDQLFAAQRKEVTSLGQEQKTQIKMVRHLYTITICIQKRHNKTLYSFHQADLPWFKAKLFQQFMTEGQICHSLLQMF